MFRFLVSTLVILQFFRAYYGQPVCNWMQEQDGSASQPIPEPILKYNGAFRKTAREYEVKVTDERKRALVLVQGATELHAVLLKGGSTYHIADLIITTYIPPRPSTNGRPVTLRIKGTDLYLSCGKDADNKPTLRLQKLEDKEQLRRINKNSDMMRFLFFRRATGRNASTLMFAQCPDWYISTAVQDSMPVDMCQESSGRYQTFTMTEMGRVG